MATKLCFLEDAYQSEIAANIIRADDRGLVLDSTVFCPAMGISPADNGDVVFPDGLTLKIESIEWDQEFPHSLLHIISGPLALPIGRSMVKLRISWAIRHCHMRVHTALHLMSIALPYPVVDGHIGEQEGFLVFATEDIQIPTKRLTRLLQELADRALPVEAVWIEKTTGDRPVRCGYFDWPESQGLIRAVRIGSVNIQPCDGLHVKNTAEIGIVEVTSIAKRSASHVEVHIRLRDRDDHLLQ